MSEILVVTNGESGVDAIRQTIGNDHAILSWDDVLHDGPVPFRNSLREQSTVRIEFLSSRANDFSEITAAEVEQKFRVRDELILLAKNYGEVVLWFDHDLYDQLQLLQVGWVLCDLLQARTESTQTVEQHSTSGVRSTTVSYVRYTDYLDASEFEKMTGAFRERTVLTSAQLRSLEALWRTFTGDIPSQLVRSLDSEYEPFASLQRALLRLCREYPSNDLSLTKTERHALTVLSRHGSLTPGRLFAECQSMEDVPFLGDWSFWRIVARLGSSANGLLETGDGGRFLFPTTTPPDQAFLDQQLQISGYGREVLAGNRRWARPDHWIGGVQLSTFQDWRWNERRSRFMRLSDSISFDES